MRIFLFICAVIGILGGFAESQVTTTVFQQIAAGQMILGGFVCLCAAALLEVSMSNLKLTREVVIQNGEVVLGLAEIRDALKKSNEALAQIAVLVQIGNEKADFALHRFETAEAKADVTRERTNQLLEWLGTVQQKARSTNA